MQCKRFTAEIAFFALFIIMMLIGFNFNTAKCYAYTRNYSASSSETLLDYTAETIKRNFEDVMTEHEIIKIFNKKGVKKYSSLSFPFSSKNQKLKVYFIKIIQPNGNIIHINLNNLKTVTAPFNPEAPIFSNQLLKTIQIPGLSKGSILDYKFRSIVLKPYMKNNFFTEDYFGGLSPLKKSVYKLTIPDGVYYRYAEYGFKEKPEIIKNSKNITLVWSLWNRKKLTPEPMGPGESFIVPHITVSSAESWNKVAEWYAMLTKDIIKPGKQLNDFIKKITASKKTKLEKIKSVYNFVAKKIRYVGYEFGIDGYKPSDVNTIFKNRLGDCKDHATLFASMLNQIGVKAYPVLIPTTEIPNMNPDIPTPFVFDHEITAIKLKSGKFMFADTTSNVTTFGDLPPMDQGRNVLIIVGGKAVIARTPIFPPSKNYISDKEYVSVYTNGSIKVRAAIIYGGAYDMYKRYLYSSISKKNKRNGVLKNIMSIAPNAKLINYSFENGDSMTKPYIERFSFTAKKYAGKNGKKIMIRIPLRTRNELAKITALKKRKYPIKFGYNFSEKTAVNINFPKNYKIMYIPQAVSFKNKVGSFKTAYSIKNGALIFNSIFSVFGYKIKTANYAAAKKLFNYTIKTLSSQVIIFNER
ncbi:MAG: DUF3857 and transglutaminase domain-containing protein [Deltaproteobacteria bacterium]|jgi:hypothetical protein|nr:DUF3857 and transglutaminase domain-containing protein [Deltaproteobacteria bacterium]